MSLPEKIQTVVIGFGVLIMAVVVISLVLRGFKGDAACPSGFPSYNETSETCCLTTTNCKGAENVTTPETFTTIDTGVTAFQEPANWVEIVIIAVIGSGIVLLFMRLFAKKRRG